MSYLFELGNGATATNHKCKLKDGTIVKYDMSSKANVKEELASRFEFIGEGEFHSVDINGKTQPMSGQGYFFRLKPIANPPEIRYPEFKDLIDKITNDTIGIIQQANDIPSTMPYKSQYVLEEVIKKLKEFV